MLCLSIFGALNSEAQKVTTVVLDAGHGGHDTGALGKNSREKDIALSIVLKLRDYIQENLPDVKVILTRKDDTFVELFRRAKIANENKADLFISVHCNSTKSSAAYGVETFVMGLHKSEANLAVAKAENAAILLEDDYVEQYDGFDPGSPEGNIFFSMMQNSFLDKSLDFAGKVQHEMVDNLKMFNRGVKQAGFLVLYKTAMPGVLIETGFISNPSDEKFLLSEKGQNQMAMAICQSLIAYKNKIERKNIARSELNDSINTNTQTQNEVKTKEQPKENEVKQEQLPVQAKNEISFSVQFASYPDAKPVSSELFRNVENVKRYFHKGLYKYVTGEFETFSKASELRSKLVKKGYNDAFVVAFKNGERISIEEARQQTEKN